MNKLYYFLSIFLYLPLAYYTIFYALEWSSTFSFIVFWVYLFLALLIKIINRFIKNDAIKKELVYVSNFLIIFILSLIPFFITLYSYDPAAINASFRFFWKVAFLYLTLALIISPLISIFKIEKTREYFIIFRKTLWILAFFYFFRHWFDYFAQELKYYWFQDPTQITVLEYIVWNIYKRMDVIIWLLAWVIIFLLWITSNKFSEKILWWKIWKWIHNLVYIWFTLSLLHIAFASRFDKYYIVLFVVLSLFRYIDFLKNSSVKSGETTKYICIVCGYIYDEALWDPDSWIAPWTKFSDIPDNWYCPICWVTKKDFIPYYDNSSSTTTVEAIETELVSYTMLTVDTLEITIRSNKKMESIPGQYITFILKDFDWDFKRSYSIVEQVNWIFFKFCIKIKPDGRWSKVLKTLKLWDKINVVWVFWNFVLKDTSNKKVFIATWTWLAPIIRMLKSDSISSYEKTLLFWVTNKDELFYINDIKNIKNLNYKIYLSREQLEWYEFWRIDLSKFDFPRDTEFYICWNPWMMKETTTYLFEKWYKNVYSEKFT